MTDHIQMNGGTVVGVVVPVNAIRSATLSASQSQIVDLREKFGDAIRKRLGIEPAGLTGPEAAYAL